MSARSKGRRKIVVNEKSYVWYVKLDDDSPFHILNIISEDKKFIISCPLKTVFHTSLAKEWCFRINRPMVAGNGICYLFMSPK